VRLTEEEEHRLVQALSECDNPQFWPLVELALTSTMRRGSLLKLEWSNIDLQAREAQVWAKGAEVTLPLSRRAITLLRHLPDNGTGRVFSMSVNAVKMAWEGVREKAGLPKLRFADLRHLGATFYARAGLNAHQLQKVLRHASTRMAEVYVNLVNSDVTEALDLSETSCPGSLLRRRQLRQRPSVWSLMCERPFGVGLPCSSHCPPRSSQRRCEVSCHACGTLHTRSCIEGSCNSCPCGPTGQSEPLGRPCSLRFAARCDSLASRRRGRCTTSATWPRSRSSTPQPKAARR
jgi:hypothetical protein